MHAITTCLVFVYTGLSLTQPATVERPFILADDFNIVIKNGKVLFFLQNNKNSEVLKGELRLSPPKNLSLETKLCENTQDNCIQFGDNVKLLVEKKDSCYNLNWTTDENFPIEACMNYGSDSWYGGPENVVQYWPFNNMTFNKYSYVTKQDGDQAVAEAYWVTTSGFYIFVDKTIPLFIDSNNDYRNGLCLFANQSHPYLPRNKTDLRFKICSYNDVRSAHINAVRDVLHSPKGIPDRRMIQHPIWSTWVRFKADVNETAVLKFAREIISNGFNNSQIEIDDNWETCYGSGQFNLSRFPDMKNLSLTLHDMGFRITLWNHPFVNTDCKLFSFLEGKGYLVQSHDGNLTCNWWNGVGGVVDFTNPDAAQWYLSHRRLMMVENGIDSLKLDAGESGWLPQIPKLRADIDVQPNAYTVAYVNTLAQLGNMIEIRTGSGTQNLPVFVRMIDKSSTWTFENGLPTLLTTLLQLNLNGYTLVLPDMVGGNAYNEHVDKELFIRWLQANTFMPAIQFSLAPWDFDEETVEISKKFTSLHYAYSGHIIRRMEECVRSGVPVNAPIWWVAPKDRVAHTVWSEFMLGDDILVAPVVEKGARSRDIYLPCGRWRDEADANHKIYVGQQWLRNYPAPLDILPFFTRIGGCKEF